jgi:hypothetical protein
MSGQLRLKTYRWIVGIAAGVLAFGVAMGSGGAVGNAAGLGAGGAARVVNGSDNGAPGSAAGTAEANNLPEVTCPGGQCFTDVTPGSTFYSSINQIYAQGLVTGYPCGGVGEPCDSASRPYYRPSANVGRGQMSKFIDNARTLAGINILSGYSPVSSISDQPNGAGLTGFGNVQDGTGVLGIGQGSGNGRTIFDLNTGGYLSGNGTSNSVGAVIYSAHDNASWVQTDDTAYSAEYVVEGKGGIMVGSQGNNPLNRVTVNGPLTVGGGCTGCTLMAIMENTGERDLHPGDVASMRSVVTGPAMVGDQPVVGAGPAQGAYDEAVVGVVAHLWVPADASAPEGSIRNTGYYDYDATSIKPGEFMGVATTGAYKEVEVSAANGPIHMGDLLVTSDTAGVAMKATDKVQAFGATLGKAMGELESGTGRIAVMLTLK